MVAYCMIRCFAGMSASLTVSCVRRIILVNSRMLSSSSNLGRPISQTVRPPYLTGRALQYRLMYCSYVPRKGRTSTDWGKRQHNWVYSSEEQLSLGVPLSRMADRALRATSTKAFVRNASGFLSMWHSS